MGKGRIKGLIQLVLVVAFVTGGVAFSRYLKTNYEPPKKREVQERPLIVNVKNVGAVDYNLKFSTTGIVKARDNVTIASEVGGRIVYVHPSFYDGGAFAADDILFAIDNTDYALKVKQLEAIVAQAKTAYELELAENEAVYEEWKYANGNKAIPDLVARKPQLRQARADLDSAKAQLEQARVNLERTKFSLPFAGRVIDSNISEGQYVILGVSYGEVFNQESLEIISSLNAEQLKWVLNAGNDLKVIATTKYMGKEKQLKASLARGVAVLESDTRFAKVRFDLEEGKEELIPGVFVDLDIEAELIKDVMLIPNEAIQNSGSVWLVEEGDILKEWKPEIIYTSKDYAVVKAIDKSVTLVSSRLSGVSSGTKVTIKK